MAVHGVRGKPGIQETLSQNKQNQLQPQNRSLSVLDSGQSEQWSQETTAFLLCALGLSTPGRVRDKDKTLWGKSPVKK